MCTYMHQVLCIKDRRQMFFSLFLGIFLWMGFAALTGSSSFSSSSPSSPSMSSSSSSRFPCNGKKIQQWSKELDHTAAKQEKVQQWNNWLDCSAVKQKTRPHSSEAKKGTAVKQLYWNIQQWSKKLDHTAAKQEKVQQWDSWLECSAVKQKTRPCSSEARKGTAVKQLYWNIQQWNKNNWLNSSGTKNIQQCNSHTSGTK